MNWQPQENFLRFEVNLLKKPPFEIVQVFIKKRIGKYCWELQDGSTIRKLPPYKTIEQAQQRIDQKIALLNREKVITDANREEFLRKYIFSPTEIKILQFRKDGLSFEAIGQELCVTRERVRQIEAKSKRKEQRSILAGFPEGFLPEYSIVESSKREAENLIIDAEVEMRLRVEAIA